MLAVFVIGVFGILASAVAAAEQLPPAGIAGGFFAGICLGVAVSAAVSWALRHLDRD